MNLPPTPWNRASKQPGFSLIELLLVLGVLAVLLAAMFVVYPRLRDMHLINEEKKNYKALTGAVDASFHNRAMLRPGSANVAVLATSGMLPKRMIQRTCPTCAPTLVSTWGQAVLVEQVTTNRMATYRVQHNNVPGGVAGCVEMGSYLLSQDHAQYVHIAAGSGSAIWTNAAPSGWDDPGAMANLIQVCQNIINQANNTARLVVMRTGVLRH